MSLSSYVKINNRYQRSVRVDKDLFEPEALDGYICINSAQNAIINTVRQVACKQCAFTWTGPYGSGKSSLALAFSRFLFPLNGNYTRVFEKKVCKEIEAVLPTGNEGWQIVPAVGRREDPVRLIASSLHDNGILKNYNPDTIDSRELLQKIEAFVKKCGGNKKHGGLLLIVDEMGKILESSALDGKDIYFFQELAELANRSEGKFIFIGILHQAIQEYAQRLSRDMRDEWLKIHGRFSDIPVSTAGEEQIELLSRALRSSKSPEIYKGIAEEVFKQVKRNRPSASEDLLVTLKKCWPLHPIVTFLLGPISKKRFGQSQRSLFAFLNSPEPKGFQDFIKNPYDENLIYTPGMFWDYLKTNLEASILASADGHRWALTVDALDRCETLKGTSLQIEILKTIAILDFVKEHSVNARKELLYSCFPLDAKETIDEAINQLQRMSLIVFRHHSSSFGIFAGSDFDIEEAMRVALGEVKSIDFGALKEIAVMNPILAKRFYHETGSMFWLEIDLCPLEKVKEISSSYTSQSGVVGQLLLTIPTNGENEEQNRKLCQEATAESKGFEIITGFTPRSREIVNLSKEVIALEKISNENPKLAGDPVARKEIQARLAIAQGLLEAEVMRLMDGTIWHRANEAPKRYRQNELNLLASTIADKHFCKTPVVLNELINRVRPSSIANAAQNALLRRMLSHENSERLGIEGFPAEAGLYESVLKLSGLHKKSGKDFIIAKPSKSDPCRLLPLWDAAEELLRSDEKLFSMSDVFKLWQSPPYGVKNGLLQLLGTAFILTMRENLAIYREEVFQTRLTDLEIELLTINPSKIQIRWMNLSEVSKNLLAELANVTRDLDTGTLLKNLAPIDVARALVGLFERLPKWTKRTMQLSKIGIKTRLLLQQAKDPNKFLFEDLPSAYADLGGSLERKHLAEIVKSVRDGLSELLKAYPEMLARFKNLLARDLQVPNLAPQSLNELNERAKNIRQIAGDYRVEAFISRLAVFDGSDKEIEGLVGLLANKPSDAWIDQDIDQAELQLAEMTEKFLRLESFARVKGRKNKRHAIAMVIGTRNSPQSFMHEFEVNDAELDRVMVLQKQLQKSYPANNENEKRLILAALAEYAASLMQASDEETSMEAGE